MVQLKSSYRKYTTIDRKQIKCLPEYGSEVWSLCTKEQKRKLGGEKGRIKCSVVIHNLIHLSKLTKLYISVSGLCYI